MIFLRVKMKGDCGFCWYWCNFWQSLFNFLFIIINERFSSGKACHMYYMEKSSWILSLHYINCTGGVRISMLALTTVDHGFEHQWSQTKDYKLVFVASPLSMHYIKEKEPISVGLESKCEWANISIWELLRQIDITIMFTLNSSVCSL